MVRRQGENLQAFGLTSAKTSGPPGLGERNLTIRNAGIRADYPQRNIAKLDAGSVGFPMPSAPKPTVAKVPRHGV